MEEKYSSSYPERVIRDGARRTLNYDIRELGEDEIKSLWEKEPQMDGGAPYDYFAKEHRYAYRSVTMGGARWTYQGIVEAIIREKYSVDEMEAITNNMAAINAVFMQTLVSGGIVEAIKFLKESADVSDADAFKEMQEWRALAKREARDVLKM